MNLARAAIHRLTGAGEVRLALVVRKDANLSAGGVASHCAEVAVNAYKSAAIKTPNSSRLWDAMGEPKVVLKAKNGEELKALLLKAERLNVLTHCVYDNSGDNQVPAVVSFGPQDKTTLDLITGDLKLF